jgi:ATP-dependent exoDNAse (exonuclease V) alpha subunit
LTSENKFIGIQGYAGVGKSHALSKVVDVLEQSVAHAKGEGFEIIGVAPYASQNKALALLGMKSQTLASFLASEKDQARLGPKSIVLLDESSVVPAHQMLKIMSKIEATGARLVMVGDKQQTQAVESGKPFEQLQDAGMQLAHITEIVRQKNDTLKKAVEQASVDKIAASIETLKTRIRELPVEEKRHKLIAKDYVSLPEEDRKKTLVVAGTNAARKNLNAEIRSQLKMEVGSAVDTFENFDMTRAEHRMAGSYKEGLLVMSEKPMQGEDLLKRGQYYEVISVDATKNTLLLKNMSDNTTQTVDPRRVGDLSVYEPNRIELAKNDWVRVTRNLKIHDLANGERYQIKEISDKEVTLSNGVKLATNERLHLQYGYVTTVHSAQGLTEDRVLIDANTKSLTSNKSVYYVAISRPRHELTIYTNDKSKLPDSMSRVPKKYAALDIRTEQSDIKITQQNLFKRIEERNQKRIQRAAMRPTEPAQQKKTLQPKVVLA